MILDLSTYIPNLIQGQPKNPIGATPLTGTALQLIGFAGNHPARQNGGTFNPSSALSDPHIPPFHLPSVGALAQNPLQGGFDYHAILRQIMGFNARNGG